MGIVFKSSFWTEATDLRTKDMSNGELGGKKKQYYTIRNSEKSTLLRCSRSTV